MTVAPLGLVAAGLVLLAVGGEALVRGAALSARLLGLTPALIGLTVVALGTSFPELVVSVAASVDAQADLAVANVIGSNLLNLTATLGLAALIMPLPTRTVTVRFEWPVLFVASSGTLMALRDGIIDRYEGSFLLISFGAFIVYSVFLARREATRLEHAALAHQAREHTPAHTRSFAYAAGLLGLGLAILIAGGHLLVKVRSSSLHPSA